jgi:hypothetical protein
MPRSHCTRSQNTINSTQANGLQTISFFEGQDSNRTILIFKSLKHFKQKLGLGFAISNSKKLFSARAFTPTSY